MLSTHLVYVLVKLQVSVKSSFLKIPHLDGEIKIVHCVKISDLVALEWLFHVMLGCAELVFMLHGMINTYNHKSDYLIHHILTKLNTPNQLLRYVILSYLLRSEIEKNVNNLDQTCPTFFILGAAFKIYIYTEGGMLILIKYTINILYHTNLNLFI